MTDFFKLVQEDWFDEFRDMEILEMAVKDSQLEQAEKDAEEFEFDDVPF